MIKFITNVNDVAPVFTSSASLSGDENQTSIGTVIATDVEGDDITFTVSGSELEITAAGVLTFAASPDYETETSYSATVTATDGINSATQDITVQVINLNDKGEKNLSLSCTLTEYTDRETILIPYRVEDRGSIETIITQSSESNGDDQNAIATTSTTTTTDGGSIQESRKLEYTQARVGIILKLKDEETGLLVWTHSYWYSGIELSSTAQVCARNSVGLISKLFNN